MKFTTFFWNTSSHFCLRPNIRPSVKINEMGRLPSGSTRYSSEPWKSCSLVSVVMFLGWWVHSVLRKLRYLCGKINIQAWLGNAEVVVEELTTTRPWKTWLLALTNCIVSSTIQSLCAMMFLRLERAPVTFSGALKDDSSGAHAFLFMRRKGLQQSLCQSPPCA